AHMDGGDFYGSEQSVTADSATDVRIELVGTDGVVTVLKEKTALTDREIIDASVMDARRLAQFFDAQIDAAKAKGVLFSLHLKAPMLKRAAPIISGGARNRLSAPVLARYDRGWMPAGFDASNGIGDLYARLA